MFGGKWGYEGDSKNQLPNPLFTICPCTSPTKCYLYRFQMASSFFYDQEPSGKTTPCIYIETFPLLVDNNRHILSKSSDPREYIFRENCGKLINTYPCFGIGFYG